jgi:hypothetical protein
MDILAPLHNAIKSQSAASAIHASLFFSDSVQLLIAMYH